MIFGHAWKNVRLQSERPVTLGVKAAENIPKFPTFPLAGGRMPSNSKVVAVAGADLFPETKRKTCIFDPSRLPSVQIGPALCTTILRLAITIPSSSTMTRFVVPAPSGLRSNERLPCV